MTILEALAANRAIYTNQSTSPSQGELPLPASPPLWEDEAWEAPSPQLPEPSIVYRLETGSVSPPLFQEEAPSSRAGEEALLEQLFRRIERENRRTSQPLTDD